MKNKETKPTNRVNYPPYETLVWVVDVISNLYFERKINQVVKAHCFVTGISFERKSKIKDFLSILEPALKRTLKTVRFGEKILKLKFKAYSGNLKKRF